MGKVMDTILVVAVICGKRSMLAQTRRSMGLKVKAMKYLHVSSDAASSQCLSLKPAPSL